MDRRRFLQNVGLIAAGSAFSGPLLSCGSQLNIPCLGPAAPPVPVPGMTYIRASEIGCALDCKLEDGHNKYKGGSATDDGPRINAALAAATADNPITLIIDGSALVSGLFLPAGGHWSIAGLGCGTGFFVKTGTNNDGIHNGTNEQLPNNPGPPAPPRGANVSLSNFTLNGNQGNGSNGDSTSGMHQGSSAAWYFGINLVNLDNITITNLVVVNTPAYHFRFSNVGNVAVSGCVIQGLGNNTDGLHFDGPANDITISNCEFTTGDDSIALNCPEGYSGNISRVTVTGCKFDSFSLMRLYTTLGGGNAKFSIDTVSVANCSGTLSESAFFIGLSSGSNLNSIASLTVSDCTLTAPTVLGLAENFGTIVLNNVTFTPSLSNVEWDSKLSNHHAAFVRPSPPYEGVMCIGSSLSFENCRILRNGSMNVPAVILEYDSMIANLEFTGFAVQDAGSGSPMSELLNVASGSVGELVLDSVTSNNVMTLTSASSFSNIGSVSGNGVLATDWKFPDAVMANEVPYISANSGLPSIKIDGVVESYPQP